MSDLLDGEPGDERTAPHQGGVFVELFRSNCQIIHISQKQEEQV